jgi:hypothetical protein
VPIPAALRGELRAHRLAQGAGGVGFVFSADGERPFDLSNAVRAARRIWQRAGLSPLGFHQCPHTYASFMIAAGVNAKALCSYMGHSSITVTLDRYGHLMPGNERQAAALPTPSSSAVASRSPGTAVPRPAVRPIAELPEPSADLWPRGYPAQVRTGAERRRWRLAWSIADALFDDAGPTAVLPPG